MVIYASELLCIEARKPKSKPLFIATWYRPPKSNHDLLQKVEHFLKLFDDEDMEITIAGDPNSNFLELLESKVTCKLFDIMNT